MDPYIEYTEEQSKQIITHRIYNKIVSVIYKFCKYYRGRGSHLAKELVLRLPKTKREKSTKI